MTKYYILSTKYSLQERQTKKNGKLYDVIFRIMDENGNTIQKKLSGYSTKTLAKHAYTEFVTANCELAKNNPNKNQKTKQTNYTIRELSLKYFASLQNQVKESSIYDKQKTFRLFILEPFGNKPLSYLTKERLLEWQDNLWATRNPKTNEFYSYKYLSNTRIHFSAFLSWCAERYGIKNYLLEIKKPKRRVPKTEMQFWTKEEFDKFIAVVDKPMYHCMFTMMFYTGRRKGEILALSPDDIKNDKIIFNKTYNRKVISAPYLITSTKNEKSGATPICPTLQKELKNYKRFDEGQFFFGGKNPIHENSVRNNFIKYCQLAGVKQIRIHDLRHSFVSRLLHLGANFMVVAELIGDTVEQVIKTYGHLYDDDKMAIISRL